MVAGIYGSIFGTIFFHDASDRIQIGEFEIAEFGLNNTFADDPNQGGFGFDARYGYGLEGNAKVGGGFLVGASWAHRLFFYVMLPVQKITGKNIYDTIWMAVTPELR